MIASWSSRELQLAAVKGLDINAQIGEKVHFKLIPLIGERMIERSGFKALCDGVKEQLRACAAMFEIASHDRLTPSFQWLESA
jgi:hypothetical protein